MLLMESKKCMLLKFILFLVIAAPNPDRFDPTPPCRPRWTCFGPSGRNPVPWPRGVPVWADRFLPEPPRIPCGLPASDDGSRVFRARRTSESAWPFAEFLGTDWGPRRGGRQRRSGPPFWESKRGAALQFVVCNKQTNKQTMQSNCFVLVCGLMVSSCDGFHLDDLPKWRWLSILSLVTLCRRVKLIGSTVVGLKEWWWNRSYMIHHLKQQHSQFEKRNSFREKIEIVVVRCAGALISTTTRLGTDIVLVS